MSEPFCCRSNLYEVFASCEIMTSMHHLVVCPLSKIGQTDVDTLLEGLGGGGREHLEQCDVTMLMVPSRGRISP